MIKQFQILAVCLLLSTAVNAHMQMSNPPPRMSTYNKNYGGTGPPDTDMVKPLFMDGSNFPCKRYAPGNIVASYKAGETISVSIVGSATHGGGHCQFSLSPDGINFVAIHTVIRDCFVGTGLTFSVKIPDNTPNCDHCVFSWSWVNAMGNRELYMNCADVKIVNENQNFTKFIGPKMVVANLPGHPTVAEWPPAKDDGRELWLNAPIISVDNTGQVSDYGGSANQYNLQMPAAKSPAPAPISFPAPVSVPAAQVPTPASVIAAVNQLEQTNEPAAAAVKQEDQLPVALDAKAYLPRTSSVTQPVTEKVSATTSILPAIGGNCIQESHCTSDKRMLKCKSGIFKEFECPEGSHCAQEGNQAYCVTEPKCWSY